MSGMLGLLSGLGKGITEYGRNMEKRSLMEAEEKRLMNLERIRREYSREDADRQYGRTLSDMVDPETGRRLTNEEAKGGSVQGAVSSALFNKDHSGSGMVDEATGRPLTRAEMESGQFKPVSAELWKLNHEKTAKQEERTYKEGATEREHKAKLAQIERAVSLGQLTPDEGKEAGRRLLLGTKDSNVWTQKDREAAINDATKLIMQQDPNLSYTAARAQAAQTLGSSYGGGAGGGNKPPLTQEMVDKRLPALLRASPEDQEETLAGLESRFANGKEAAAQIRQEIAKQNQARGAADAANARKASDAQVSEYARVLQGLKSNEEKQAYLAKLQEEHGEGRELVKRVVGAVTRQAPKPQKSANRIFRGFGGMGLLEE